MKRDTLALKLARVLLWICTVLMAVEEFQRRALLGTVRWLEGRVQLLHRSVEKRMAARALI